MSKRFVSKKIDLKQIIQQMIKKRTRLFNCKNESHRQIYLCIFEKRKSSYKMLEVKSGALRFSLTHF